MGMTYARIKDTGKKLLALTGWTRTEFETVLAAFREVGKRKTELTANGKPRKRKSGGVERRR